MSTDETRKSYREAKTTYLEYANGYEIGTARDAGAAGAGKYAQEIAVGLKTLKTSVDEHLEEGLPAGNLRQTMQALEAALAEIQAAKGRPGPAPDKVDDLFIKAIEELQKHSPSGGG